MILIKENFKGTVNFSSYDQVVGKIKEFDDYEIIGQDESGLYDMYAIHLGNKEKPKILIDCGMHGTEWHPIMYTLEYFKRLSNDELNNKELTNRLLNDFHLILVPVMNPWGFDRTTRREPKSRNKGRRNSNDIDLNGDFNDFTQQESKNMKFLIDNLKPFAYLNCHMQTPDMGNNQGNNLIVGNGQGATNYVKEDWIENLKHYTKEQVTNWLGYTNLKRGLSRRYVRDKYNPYTPNTLSYITEIVRPQENENGTINSPLSEDQIFEFGMYNTHLFFITSIKYYDEKVNNIPYENDELIPEVLLTEKMVMEHKTIYFDRNNEGFVMKIREEYDETCDNMIIETIFKRDSNGYVENFIRTKK